MRRSRIATPVQLHRAREHVPKLDMDSGLDEIAEVAHSPQPARYQTGAARHQDHWCVAVTLPDCTQDVEAL